MKSTFIIVCFILFIGLAAIAGDSTTRLISTVAGNETQMSTRDGGPATLAPLNGKADIAVDSAGNLYIAESNAIRKVSADGVMSTVPGAPAGTASLSINPVGSGDPLKRGWATVATSGGVLNGVATYHLMSGGVTQAATGVLPSQPMRCATIPIGDPKS